MIEGLKPYSDYVDSGLPWFRRIPYQLLKCD
jgi:hypothetical protein